jgi:hypothetical protein
VNRIGAISAMTAAALLCAHDEGERVGAVARRVILRL